jgi:hypothetical protein
VRGDDVVGEPREHVDLAVGRVNLERAEADERWCHAADDRAGLGLRMAVVEHVAHDGLARADQAQGSRRGHPERVHRLRAEELAHRRPQDRPSVSLPGVRRRAGTLQLQFMDAAVGTAQLAQRDGAAIPQLVGPMAELMPPVTGRVGIRARQEPVAGQHVGRRARPERWSP